MSFIFGRTSRGFLTARSVVREELGEIVELQASSAIDENLPGAFENPGTSYLWLRAQDKHTQPNSLEQSREASVHLSRQQARELALLLMKWSETGAF